MTSLSLVRGELRDAHNAPSDTCSRLWLDAILQTENPYELRLQAATTTKAVDIKADGNLLATFDYEYWDGTVGRRMAHDFLWETDRGLMRVEDLGTQLRIRILTNAETDLAKDLMEEMRKQITPPKKQKRTEVRVKFWRLTHQGGQAFIRYIEAPTWNSIERNYADKTKGQLRQLMKLKPKEIGTGKIILLHGPAGTGKTTAIRAIAREWQKWCDLGYAIDPECVFGSGDYLTSLIADEESHDEWDIPEGITPAQRTMKWRLVVIEDAEEFLVPDAKHEVGQAVSRLLNVGDGILGQGLKVLVLLTTNVPVGKLSPAITRAGRCLANIEVPAMSKAEASAWLGKDVPSGATLAELWETSHPTQIGTGIADKTAAGQYL